MAKKDVATLAKEANAQIREVVESAATHAEEYATQAIKSVTRKHLLHLLGIRHDHWRPDDWQLENTGGPPSPMRAAFAALLVKKAGDLMAEIGRVEIALTPKEQKAIQTLYRETYRETLNQRMIELATEAALRRAAEDAVALLGSIEEAERILWKVEDHPGRD